MHLFLLRHAWAGHFGDPQWPDDSRRPLTADGEKRFARVAKRLVGGGCRPAVVATSPYTRCRQTAEMLAKALPQPSPIVELSALTPSSDLASLVAWTNDQNREDIVWVGHNPDLPRMAAELIGSRGAHLRFAKAACACIRFEEDVEVGGGQLYWLATARLLGC